MTSCTFVPRVQRQLTGDPTAGDDCGIRTIDWLLTWASCAAIRVARSAEIRARSGNATGPTTIFQVKAGFEGYAAQFTAAGLSVPRMQIRSNGKLFRPFADLVTALEADMAAAIFLDYGVVNDEAPELSGSSSFRGTHIIPLYGIRTDSRGRRFVTSFDPLYDGRRHGIPNGPQEVPLRVIRHAMAAVKSLPSHQPLGDGLGVFGIAARAASVAMQLPPAPALVTRAELDAAIAERDAAQTALGLIAQLGADMAWPRLVDLAQTGLPAPNTAAQDASVNEGGAPAEDTGQP